MSDPTETHFSNAVIYGGEQAGAYLESIGKTDLITLTKEEWLTFLGTVVSNFQEKIGEDYIPF